MSRTLILMRHAKSSWDNPEQSDHARPLNGRGKRSATALGNWLITQRYLPDEVLCSSAERTRETFNRLNLDCPVQYLDGLYHAGPERMLRILATAQGDTVLMLGHNPGIGMFARQISTAPPPHPRFSDYPTGATMVAKFDIETWKSIRMGTGNVMDFIIPRELIPE